MNTRIIELIDGRRYDCLADIVSADPHISQVDRWSSDLWHLDGHLAGYGRVTINWRFDAPHGVIDVLKLVAVDLFIGVGREPPYSHRTANLFAQAVKYLGGFMVSADYGSLAELDEAAYEKFKQQLTTTISRPSENADVFIETIAQLSLDGAEPADEVGEPDEPDSGSRSRVDTVDGDDDGYGDENDAVEEDAAADVLTISIATSRLSVWMYLHRARVTLATFKVNGPTFYPFAASSLRAAAINIATKGLEEVEPLPDAVAIPILNHAWRLLGVAADDVIELQTRFIAVRDDVRLGSRSREKALRSLVEGFAFSALEEGRPPWRGPIRVAATAHGTGSLELRRLVRELHMAAVVMLLAGTGVRISEVCGIEVEDREIDAELPSCIMTKPSLSESNEHFMLHAFLYKNQRGPRVAEWLLGARPIKAHAEPPTVRAIRVLERLLQPWRRMAVDPFLGRQLQVSLFGPGFPVQTKAIQFIRVRSLHALMGDFFAGVGLAELLAPLTGDDPRLRVYAATNGRCIHPHQWRHTYYEYMVRLNPRLLPAVSLHFKHSTLAATENGYGSKDAAVRENKDSVRVRETVRSFTRRRFGSVPPVGKLAKEIERHRTALETIVGDVPGAEAEARVEEFVRGNDIRIWQTEYGSCLFALNPMEGRCRKVNGTSDFRAGTPDFATREPSLCCGCPNFSIGVENASFWRQRYVENRTAWVQSGRNPFFRVALQRAEQSAAILRQLGHPVPVILKRPLEGLVGHDVTRASKGKTR